MQSEAARPAEKEPRGARRDIIQPVRTSAQREKYRMLATAVNIATNPLPTAECMQESRRSRRCQIHRLRRVQCSEAKEQLARLTSAQVSDRPAVLRHGRESSRPPSAKNPRAKQKCETTSGKALYWPGRPATIVSIAA